MQNTRISHLTERDENNRFYCRAMNDITDHEYLLCESCPLFGGFFPGRTGEKCPDCVYYDVEADNLSEFTPDELKKRTDGLIMAQMATEFPRYLPEDEGAKQFSVIEKAVMFAAEAHKGSFRKGSKLPYIVHPIETMMIVAGITNDNEVIAAAALHDVVEDTPYTAKDIRERFGERIEKLVDLESENKREGMPKSDTWEIRKKESLEREKDAPYEAKIIMLGDKVSNMRATLRDYRKNGDKIWEKFNMKDVKKQEWYYRGVAEVLSELKDLPAYKEYLSILDEVFG